MDYETSYITYSIKRFVRFGNADGCIIGFGTIAWRSCRQS